MCSCKPKPQTQTVISIQKPAQPAPTNQPK